MAEKPPDDRLWFLLLGAALASKPHRDAAAKVLEASDAPRSLAPLWKAVRLGDASGAREAMRDLGVLAATEETLADAVLRTVQERSLDAYWRQAIKAVEFSRIQTAEEALTVIEHLATKIRVKQASLDKPSG